MPMIPFASFLAGSILSLVLPLALLIAVTTWFHFAQRRIPEAQRTPRGATTENPPAANPATGGQAPVGEATGSGSAGTGLSSPPTQQPPPGGSAGTQSGPGGP
jgi:hypothetical protein